MTPSKDPLFTKFRTMAILCMLLGPLLVSSSLVTIGASHLVEWAKVEGAAINPMQGSEAAVRAPQRSEERPGRNSADERRRRTTGTAATGLGRGG